MLEVIKWWQHSGLASEHLHDVPRREKQHLQVGEGESSRKGDNPLRALR